MPPLPINPAPLGGVPIGTIVPYVGPLRALPPNWVICDGAVINNPQSPLNGQPTPRLTDNRFFMSVPQEEDVLNMGGLNEIPRDGLHTHTYSGTTAPDSAPILVKEKENLNSSVSSFPHTHTFSGTVSPAGEHSHGGENRPRYVSVLYILRVA